jgi:hypothetical protein
MLSLEIVDWKVVDQSLTRLQLHLLDSTELDRHQPLRVMLQEKPL